MSDFFLLLAQGGLTVGLAVAAFRVGALDKSGLVSAALIGILLVFGGGWRWLVLATAFLFLAFQLTRFRYAKKQTLGSAETNRGARRWTNVVANGAVPSFAAIFEGLFGGGIFVVAFVGAIATSAADTLATELGLLSRSKPRLLTNVRHTVLAGTSGGVTKLGLLAAMSGALFIGVLAGLLNVGNEYPLKFILIGTAVGFTGSVVDSLLGATFQGKYRCGSCGTITERPVHHDGTAVRVAGFSIIDNNVVNFVSTALAALIAVALFVYL